MAESAVTVFVTIVGTWGLAECQVCGPIFVAPTPVDTVVREHLTTIHSIRQRQGV